MNDEWIMNIKEGDIVYMTAYGNTVRRGKVGKVGKKYVILLSGEKFDRRTGIRSPRVSFRNTWLLEPTQELVLKYEHQTRLSNILTSLSDVEAVIRTTLTAQNANKEQLVKLGIALDNFLLNPKKE